MDTPTTSQAEALLARLAGRWRMQRTIADRAGGADATFDGVAVFAPDAHGLTCDETGLLRLGDAAPMRAERRYLWRAEGARVAVRFADGRPFHAFAPGPAPGARHDCPPDLYLVRYDFARWPDWAAEWRVSGPRKDYTMRTLYTRP